MSEENQNDALALIPNMPITRATQEQVDAVTGNSWLPRLQLMASSSDAVKEGKIQPGLWALVKDKANPMDLGKEVDILVIAWHPKAMDLSSGTPVSYFDIKSDAFKSVARRSAVKDSGCMYGSEFFIWIPSKAALATLYFGSKSARKASPDMLDLMKKAAESQGVADGYAPTKATLKVKFVPKSATITHSFHAPVVTPCTTVMTVAPDPEILTEELNKFNNPIEAAVETVDAAKDTGRAR